ncbi:uncharacterized protein EKO05_0002890 [Ascochyta rabiei]|uniref:uncharacterized protein n=1 Tax=Didymella rabiei TaxID=5454 RepID=UPI0022065318|nr:uncharacterized protein EKO05_0002890 [Ascochyta rabiei]UPX12336.1 hypothetical protein EKO05_0002890 [Ascochyta rabiei]
MWGRLGRAYACGYKVRGGVMHGRSSPRAVVFDVIQDKQHHSAPILRTCLPNIYFQRLFCSAGVGTGALAIVS